MFPLNRVGVGTKEEVPPSVVVQTICGERLLFISRVMNDKDKETNRLTVTYRTMIPGVVIE